MFSAGSLFQTCKTIPTTPEPLFPSCKTIPETVATLKSKLRGVWNYYGVIGNAERNGRFAWFAQRLVYKWLNRRSQRRSYNMTAFMAAWERWKIPMPCVVEQPWPQARQAPPRTI